MRAVTTRTVAHALGLTDRQVANILSRYPVRALSRGRQGQSRRIPVQTVEHLALALELEAALRDPLTTALSLADRLMAEGTGHIESDEVLLHVDLPALRSRVMARLAQAVEESVPIARGRPPGS